MIAPAECGNRHQLHLPWRQGVEYLDGDPGFLATEFEYHSVQHVAHQRDKSCSKPAAWRDVWRHCRARVAEKANSSPYIVARLKRGWSSSGEARCIVCFLAV